MNDTAWKVAMSSLVHQTGHELRGSTIRSLTGVADGSCHGSKKDEELQVWVTVKVV